MPACSQSEKANSTCDISVQTIFIIVENPKIVPFKPFRVREQGVQKGFPMTTPATTLVKALEIGGGKQLEQGLQRVKMVTVPIKELVT